MLLTKASLLSLLPSTLAFSITSITTSLGVTEESPATSADSENGRAQPIELRCDLEFNTGEQWTWCAWTHEFEKLWVDTGAGNVEGFVMCSASHQADHQQVCEDKGNLKENQWDTSPDNNPYTKYDTSRLVHSLGEDYCGLTIMEPHANDTGVWKCHVQDNNPNGETTKMRSEVEVFVANKSVVAITHPDPTDKAKYSIEVDLAAGTTKIEAECEAKFGLPPPSIRWYIDEPSNVIDQQYQSDSTKNDGTTVESTIQFTLDAAMLSRLRVKEVNSYFSFSLGCLPDQSNYFQHQDDWNPAQVMVYGTSGSQGLVATSLLLLASTTVLAIL